MNTFNLYTLYLRFVGVSGAFSVLFGAWLAHAGQSLPVDIAARLETAQFYQIVHTLALLCLCLYGQVKPSKLIAYSASFFCIGILLFSGSLYLKTVLDVPLIGKLAPFGGISLAIGWLTLVFNVTTRKI